MNGFKNPGYPFVVVAWDDAKMVNDEQKIEDIHDSPTTLFYTTGWLIKMNDKGLWIAAEWAPDDHTWRTITSVPRGWVREMTEFNLSKKRKKKEKGAAPVVEVAAPISVRETDAGTG
jgi:hypothetical protein